MKNKSYNEFFTSEYMMGPNCLPLLEELLELSGRSFAGERLLDLGCGRAVTSLYLARETAAQSVFAADLWISAEENYSRICGWNEQHRIIPVCADAAAMPFAKGYFDAIISVDAYHYFGCKKGFFAEKMLPLLSDKGCALIAVPGLTEEAQTNPHPLLVEWAGQDDAAAFHSASWWSRHISEGAEGVQVTACESLRFDEAWNDWFNSGHEYALEDKKYLDMGLETDLAFIPIEVRRRG